MLFRYNTLTVLWILVIMGLTFTPGPSIPRLPTWKFISFDTFVHAFIFCVLVFLMSNAFKRNKSESIFNRYSIVFPVGIAITFGALIEIIQPYIPGRTFEYYDILSNSIGSILAVPIVYIQRKIFYPSK